MLIGMLLLSAWPLVACHPSDPASGDPAPPAPGLLPFPRADLIGAGGLSLPTRLPQATTPIPIERLSWRSGFSPVQTVVLRFDEAIDPSTLPSLAQIGVPGSIQLWDLTTGTNLPCFAELDAYPDLQGEPPTLLVRPALPATPGHRVAMVITSDVLTTSGEPLPSPPWFAAASTGVDPVGTTGMADHYADLLQQLEGLSLPDPVLALDWPVSDGTAPLRSMLASLNTPDTWTLPEVVDTPADLPARTWKQATGTFTADNWLLDDDLLVYSPNGTPLAQGTTEAQLFIHMPESVRGEVAGRAPVWIFGHGIFSSPQAYLEDKTDPSGVIALADRAGAIVIATVWRGLTTSDIAIPVNVGGDFGQIPRLTDRLAQGVANTVSLIHLVTQGRLLDDPFFNNRADRGRVRYYGISLGSIEGAVTLALDQNIPHGVLHVGGSTWSTMLERSKNWLSFEDLITSSIRSASDRQLLYSVSQLFWDPVDPALYTGELRERSLLWQVAIGDDQVPNLTSFTLARGVGLTVLEPNSVSPAGLGSAPAPLSGPAMSLFDPQLGNHEGQNRPSPATGAHEAPRLWEGTALQTLLFLDEEEPGTIQHFCGDGMCSATNPGP